MSKMCPFFVTGQKQTIPFENVLFSENRGIWLKSSPPKFVSFENNEENKFKDEYQMYLHQKYEKRQIGQRKG